MKNKFECRWGLVVDVANKEREMYEEEEEEGLRML